MREDILCGHFDYFVTATKRLVATTKRLIATTKRFVATTKA